MGVLTLYSSSLLFILFVREGWAFGNASSHSLIFISSHLLFFLFLSHILFSGYQNVPGGGVFSFFVSFEGEGALSDTKGAVLVLLLFLVP